MLSVSAGKVSGMQVLQDLQHVCRVAAVRSVLVLPSTGMLFDSMNEIRFVNADGDDSSFVVFAGEIAYCVKGAERARATKLEWISADQVAVPEHEFRGKEDAVGFLLLHSEASQLKPKYFTPVEFRAQDELAHILAGLRQLAAAADVE
eukprot:gene12655-biopygen7320